MFAKAFAVYRMSCRKLTSHNVNDAMYEINEQKSKNVNHCHDRT